VQGLNEVIILQATLNFKPSIIKPF